MSKASKTNEQGQAQHLKNAILAVAEGAMDMREPMNERETVRFRNTKNHWAVGPHPLFWVGQVVGRSWERESFEDKIGQRGVVVELPTKRNGSLAVEVDGEPRRWSLTECKPIRVIYEENRKRLARRSRAWAAALKDLDEDGILTSELTGKEKTDG